MSQYQGNLPTCVTAESALCFVLARSAAGQSPAPPAGVCKAPRGAVGSVAIHMRFGAELPFDSGKSASAPAGPASLQQLAEVLLGEPEPSRDDRRARPTMSGMRSVTRRSRSSAPRLSGSGSRRPARYLAAASQPPDSARPSPVAPNTFGAGTPEKSPRRNQHSESPCDGWYVIMELSRRNVDLRLAAIAGIQHTDLLHGVCRQPDRTHAHGSEYPRRARGCIGRLADSVVIHREVRVLTKQGEAT